jgi:phage terminase large subunit-like protein
MSAVLDRAHLERTISLERGLSNTATPKYYGAFREAVLRGEIPVCREVSLQMNRIDALIADPNFYYDENAIEGFIRYCENELTLTDGSDFFLLDSFKLWAEDLLGWFYFVERSVYVPNPDGHGGHYVRRRICKRLRNKQYLIVARGAAKSMYAMLIQAYFLNIDTSTTHQVTTAPTMKQAEEVMAPFRTAITRARGPLFQFLTEGSLQNTTGSKANRVKLASTKVGIQNFLTGSILEVRPMSINKLQGLRPKVSTVDEWLSGDIREDVIGALEQGASKMLDYIIVAVSSEGTVRNGSGDTIKLELADILKGDYINPHVSIWHYRLDELEEVADPAMWPKANPNIGITVTYETYHLDVERAENAPAARNDILAKRFGIPMEGFTYFFTYEETLPHRRREFWRMPCAMGADLSQGDDFCAFTFLFPLRADSFGVKTRSYISSLTLAKLPGAMRQKYEEFIEEGSLHVLEGATLDLMEVYDDLEQFILDNEYDVRAFGYDPYNAKEFVTRWESENGPFGIEKVIQGARTESVPLGELKKLAGERWLIFDQELMSWAMGNAITMEDTNGNRKLLKKRQDQKIDNVAAMLDAFVAFKLNKDSF